MTTQRPPNDHPTSTYKKVKKEKKAEGAPARKGGQGGDPAPDRTDDYSFEEVAELERLAFSIYGNSGPFVATWLQRYPRPWVVEAMEKTAEIDHPTTRYTGAVLREWWNSGGPAAEREAKQPQPQDREWV